jgi:hypothetical protein
MAYLSGLADIRRMMQASRTNEERKDKAYNAKIARYMRKKHPELNESSYKELWKNLVINEERKLSFLILTYLYSQDDLKLDKKETKEIKQLIKQTHPDISSDDLIEIYNWFQLLPTKDFVMSYIRENEITDDMFYNANDFVIKHYKNKKKYVQLLKELRNHYALGL